MPRELRRARSRVRGRAEPKLGLQRAQTFSGRRQGEEGGPGAPGRNKRCGGVAKDGEETGAGGGAPLWGETGGRQEEG